MRFRRRIAALGLSTLLVSIILAPRAVATTPLPRADAILVAPLDPTHIVISSSVGIFVSRDAGQTFDLVCVETWNGDDLRTEPMALGADGALYIANAFDGLWMSRDGCSFHDVATVSTSCGQPSCLVKDVTAAQGGRQIIAALTTGSADSDALQSELWHSQDAGTTWARLGEPLPTDFAITDVAVSPVNASSIWVLGYAADGPALLQHSTDQGDTYAELPLPPDMSTGPGRPRIGALSPADEAVAFFIADGAIDFRDPEPAALFVTWDGGQTFELAFQSTGALYGVTVEPDGQTVWLSGPADGLLSATLDRLRAQGPAAFEPVLGPRTFGLSWAGEGVYVGTDQFGEAFDGRFTLSRVSQDGTASGMLSLCDARLAACAADTCQPRFERFVHDMAPACEPPPVLPDAGKHDAGGAEGERSGQPQINAMGTGTAVAETGCGCQLGTRRPLDAAPLALLMGLAALRRRRRHLQFWTSCSRSDAASAGRPV